MEGRRGQNYVSNHFSCALQSLTGSANCYARFAKYHVTLHNIVQHALRRHFYRKIHFHASSMFCLLSMPCPERNVIKGNDYI